MTSKFVGQAFQPDLGLRQAGKPDLRRKSWTSPKAASTNDFGFSSSRRDGVRIAHRFNGGSGDVPASLVPEGRLSTTPALSRPSGTKPLCLPWDPTVETVGYSHTVPPGRRSLSG